MDSKQGLLLDLQQCQAMAPWYLKLWFAYQKFKYGKVLEPIVAWSLTPKVLLKFLSLWRTLDRSQSPLEPALRSLVSIKVSQLTACAFCVDLHQSRYLQYSDAEIKLAALADYKDNEIFTPVEQTALSYAEAMTQETVQISSEIQTALQQHFTQPAIVELTAVIAFQNMSSRFNSALGVQAYGFCKVSKK